ncbi:hypothetical protein [Rhizobium sp. L245/93]|uniref:hypothetical protein n=1 Tax=Rhizobium sp. L245/93 TaxID=2819998 RepID=UPI001ADA42C2|nr:hypothetical protein [Rhizobium sp. L245/93]MBO9168352.1 hypothetical protein [Rhizobium sp. L245/93]
MSRSKDDFIKSTGGFRFGESQDEFKSRVKEIGELENALKSGQVSLKDVESVQRRLCELKGINFDDDDEFD